MYVAAWWYMTIAQIILLLVPFLDDLIKRYGGLVPIATIALLPYIKFSGARIISPYGGPYLDYLFVLILGVWFAEEGLMDRLGGTRSSKWYLCLLDCILMLAAICLCIHINYKYSANDGLRLTKVLMGACAALIALVSFKYFTNPVVEKVLCFLGRHSGNVFLVHSLFYYYYIKYVYWSHNVFVTWLTLMAAGILVSYVLGWIRRMLHSGFGKLHVKRSN